MIYHLPSIFRWAENGFVWYYAMHIDRQVYEFFWGGGKNKDIHASKICFNAIICFLCA